MTLHIVAYMFYCSLLKGFIVLYLSTLVYLVAILFNLLHIGLAGSSSHCVIYELYLLVGGSYYLVTKVYIVSYTDYTNRQSSDLAIVS